MPPGIPVATVAIGKAGAINAAVLAVEILALQDEELKRKKVTLELIYEVVDERTKSILEAVIEIRRRQEEDFRYLNNKIDTQVVSHDIRYWDV